MRKFEVIKTRTRVAKRCMIEARDTKEAVETALVHMGLRFVDWVERGTICEAVDDRTRTNWMVGVVQG